MKTIVFLLAICLTNVASFQRQHERIVGGSPTTVNVYPFAASLQITLNHVTFNHHCGTSIVNNRSVLTSAHCWLAADTPTRWRVRLGSTNVSSGGRHHNVAQLIRHPQYVGGWNLDFDVAIVRLSTAIPLGSATIRAANLAGANTNIADNANVIAIGWGYTTPTGGLSESLRHVQLQVFSLAQCRRSYGTSLITDNMVCAGWAAGGRGSCTHDSGSALLLNNVVVGITGFGARCAEANWPGVYTRVNRFITWIRNTA